MPMASERIPILVTKTDKTRFTKKAKSFGFTSISEFARAAMDRFHTSPEDEAALAHMLARVQAGTRQTEQSLDQALAYCDASNARMEDLARWMKENGYQ